MQVSGVALLVSNSEGKAILEVAGRPLFELNPVGAIIWEKLATGLPPREIIAQFVTRFGISEEQAAADVTNFIELLRQHFLVYDDTQISVG